MFARLWSGRSALAWSLALPLLLLLPPEALAASVNLDQVRNGGSDSPTDPGHWQNGNLNASQAHYVEGWSVAYRVVMTDVPTGAPVTLTLGYDIKHSDTHALDYLTHFDRLEPHEATFGHEKETVDPLIDTGLTMASPMSTFAIPVPTSVGSPVAGQPATSFQALPADERVMTMWNGTITEIQYATQGDLMASQEETQISVTFTPTDSTVVLAWGGHIASRRDWGFHGDGTPLSAAGISGSPYHMRVIDWTLGNLGQQDRSLAAAAVFPPPMCEITGQGLLCEGGTAVYQAMTDDPSATYEWSFLGNTAGAFFVGSNTDTTATVETTGPGFFELQLTISSLTGTSVCDTLVTVTAVPTADAGEDTAVCSDDASEIPLSGVVGGGASGATWTTSGTGSFANAGDPGTTYFPSAADISSGSVTLTLTTDDPEGPCVAAADSMVVTITPAATVDAGADQEVCSVPAPVVTLSGSFGGGASSALWTTSGTGFFGDASDPTTNYTPSAGDVAAGSVVLTLTTDSPGEACGPAVDSLTVTIHPAATVDAGADQSACSLPEPSFTLAGSFGGGAGSATWSTSGTGSFADASDPTTTYFPSAADISSGTVTLTLTTDDPAGPCDAESDTMVLTISPAATVSAGSDIDVCSLPAPVIPLDGLFGGGASSATWSTSGSGAFADPTNPKTDYVPSAADIAAGTVTLTLSTNDPGDPCGAAFDEVVVTIHAAAEVSAGDDQEVCSLPDPSITLSGSFGGGASGVTWTTSGSGSFANPGSASTMYEPSAADIAAGTVTLTLTTNDPAGPCDAAQDALTVSIYPAATVDAGDDVAVCSDPAPTIDLNGFFGGGATGAVWSTSGSGSFANANAAITTYTPSAADVASGSVVLTFTTDDPAGPCGAASDSLRVTISPAAVASAGADQVLCTLPAPVAQLIGSFGGGATGASWTTSGGGTFADATDPNTTYTPSGDDIVNGTVTLTLTTNDPEGSCGAVSDEMVIGFLPAATVNAGNDASVCALPAPVIQLDGAFGGGGSGVTWSTSGTGSFEDANDPDTKYTPSAEDIAAGSVLLTLTTNDPEGPCGEVSDELLLTIFPVPTADAGDDQEACAMPAPVFEIAGSVGGSATTGSWSSSGTGSFGNAASLATTYTPSQADLDAGSVVLTLTTDDPEGPCPAGSDEVKLTIFPLPDCELAYPDVLPFAGSIGNELSGPPGMADYFWSLTGNGTMTGGQGTDTITYDVGPNLGQIHITLTMTDDNGCQNTCEISLYVVEPGSVVCSFTQGFFGNRGGKFNQVGTLNMIRSVLDVPMVLGDASRGFEVPLASAECVIERLPAGVTPTTLPEGLGFQVLPADDCQTDPGLPVDSSGKWENILLGQTTANTLNQRLDPDLPDVRLCARFVTVKALPGPDGILGTDDDVPSGDPDHVRVWTIPQSVLDRLGANVWVSGLLELANSALAGHEDPGLISDINHAVSTINEAFDQCRFIVEDCRVPRARQNQMVKNDMGNLRNGGFGDLVGGAAVPDLPSQFALHGPRPNPVRGSAEIRFDLPVSSSVALEIFDVTGRRVRVLENRTVTAGRHVLQWDGRDDHGSRVAAGMYFYRLQAGEFRDIRKMVVLR